MLLWETKTSQYLARIRWNSFKTQEQSLMFQDSASAVVPKWAMSSENLSLETWLRSASSATEAS